MHKDLTRLEHFSACALTGLLANPAFHEQESVSRSEPDRDIIRLAVKMAMVLEDELRMTPGKDPAS